MVFGPEGVGEWVVLEVAHAVSAEQVEHVVLEEHICNIGNV